MVRNFHYLAGKYLDYAVIHCNFWGQILSPGAKTWINRLNRKYSARLRPVTAVVDIGWIGDLLEIENFHIFSECVSTNLNFIWHALAFYSKQITIIHIYRDIYIFQGLENHCLLNARLLSTHWFYYMKSFAITFQSFMFGLEKISSVFRFDCLERLIKKLEKVISPIKGYIAIVFLILTNQRPVLHL